MILIYWLEVINYRAFTIANSKFKLSRSKVQACGLIAHKF